MADVNVENLLPNGIYVIGEELGLEDPSRAELASNVRVCSVAGLEIEEGSVCVWQVLGLDHVDAEAAVEEVELGLVKLILD